MPRPVVQHDGFLVPNAATVSNPRMAEPDRIDFNTIAHAQWGVVEGCEVTVSGATASITSGMAVVDGLLVPVNQQSVSLGVGGAQDRFDLIVVNQGGTIQVIIGAYSTDPVFPDPPKTVTVLAAVFAPATQSNFSDNVIDKRKFVIKQLLTKIEPGEMLVRNANGSGNHYSITGGGLTSWLGDTSLWRTSPGTLRVQSKLTVDDTLGIGGAFTADSVTVVNRVQASNIISDTEVPSSGRNGAIFQNETNGKIFVWQDGAWQELATISSTIPLGTVITSLEKPSVMEPKGWVALNGQTVTEGTHPRLFTIDALIRYVTSGTEAAHDRVMNLPNLNGVVPAVGFSGVGTIPPLVAPNGQPRVTNQVSLTTANMPRHKHNTASASGGGATASGATVGRSGDHSHIGSDVFYKGLQSGAHHHQIYDPGHAHYGVTGDGGSALTPEGGMGASSGVFIGTAWAGQNKLIGSIGDSTSTVAVGQYNFTGRAYTRNYIAMPAPIGDTPGDGGHRHDLGGGGDHNHNLSFDASAFVHSHDLTEQEVGGNVSFDVSPVSFTLYAYVRS